VTKYIVEENKQKDTNTKRWTSKCSKNAAERQAKKTRFTEEEEQNFPHLSDVIFSQLPPSMKT